MAQKRKAAAPIAGSGSVGKKRQKYQDARTIPTQTADKALSKNGELNINHFIQAREFEVNALDKSMQKARRSLMTRAFQSVPRHMRRRTASHNAKKVPRRLRRRAEREMKDDNTPTVTSKTRNPTSRLRLRLQNASALKRLNTKRQSVRQKRKGASSTATELDPSKHVSLIRTPRLKKNTLADAPTASSKFKRRQLSKTWLPTHLWHTKRAHMTRSSEPLWRMAIPLTPSEKSYRPTHRAAHSRGAIVWDVSYMCTIGCLGTDHALENLLKALNFSGEGWFGPRYQKWKAGTRFASSWIQKKINQAELVAPILVIWAPALMEDLHLGKASCVVQTDVMELDAEHGKGHRRKRRLDRRLLIRIHPSAFHEFWILLLQMAKMQKPQVLVEDLRFEIGSIDVTGPGAAEALNAVLKPRELHDPAAKLWSALSGITNAAALPLNALLALDIEDPRLNHPPKQVSVNQKLKEDTHLLELLTNWPMDASKTISPLFSHKLRHNANKLLSQKAINRQRAKSATDRTAIVSSNAMTIPTIVLAQRADDKQPALQGTWTVLAPWKCIDPIWRSLMYCPLSSGGHPRFGGLQEQQQISFERCLPWFPADMPGTEAGKAWERSLAERKFDEWVSKPPSRRLPFHSIDLGLGRRGEIGVGWRCDWDCLLRDTVSPQKQKKSSPEPQLVTQVPPTQKTPLTQRQRKATKQRDIDKEETSRDRNISSPESDTGDIDEPISAEYSQMSTTTAASILTGSYPLPLPTKPALISIRITLLTKGTPSSAARIYRLPKATTASSKPTRHVASLSGEQIQQRVEPSNSTPAAAQQSPATPSSTTILDTKQSSATLSDLRTRWLKVYKSTSRLPLQSGGPTHIPKLKTNHHSMPRKHHVHPVPNLRDVIVLPPDAPQEVIDQHGPKLPTEAELREKEQAALHIRLEEESVWDSHVPCPDEEDLIGFVTSGGYNLSQGRGTAIGSIWVQRLKERWSEEDQLTDDANDHNAEQRPLTAQRAGKGTKQEKIQKRQKVRERQLCIVRNAGESVGRLGIWELCH